jgi:DNA-binding PadR family transcriptional regulator
VSDEQQGTPPDSADQLHQESVARSSLDDKRMLDAEMRAREENRESKGERQAREEATAAADRAGPDPPLTELELLLLILCAAREGGTSGGEVLAFAEEWSIDLRAVENTVYARLRKLKERGLLDSWTEPGERRGDRRSYAPSGEARKFIRQWLQTPVRPPDFDREIFVRLHFALGDKPGWITAGLLPLHRELERKLREVERRAAVARKTSSWGIGVELAYDLERKLLQAYLDWFDQAVKKLPTAIEKNFGGAS